MPNPLRPQLRQRLEHEIDRLAELVSSAEGIESVILIGSSARGEDAAAEVEGRLERFSDVELFAVTSDRLPAARRRAISGALDQAAAGFGYRSPLFHADLAFRERSRLGSMPASLFTFELRECGRTLRGAELLREVRPVGAGDIDLANTREIHFKRLWALAQAIPADWLRGRPLDEIRSRSFGVSIRRNALDLPTALLPGGGVLLGGYQRRLAHWRDHPESQVRRALDRISGMNSLDLLQRCTALRLSCAPPADAAREHAEVVRLIAAALAYELERLGGRRSSVGDPLEIEPQLAEVPGMFAERPRSRGIWLAYARQAVRNSYTAGPIEALSWPVRPRKACLAAALVALHAALILRAERSESAGLAALDRSIAWSTRAAPELRREAWLKVDRSDEFADRWLVARQAAGLAFWRLIRLGDPQARPQLGEDPT